MNIFFDLNQQFIKMAFLQGSSKAKNGRYLYLLPISG
jgi:hypothetical protein